MLTHLRSASGDLSPALSSLPTQQQAISLEHTWIMAQGERACADLLLRRKSLERVEFHSTIHRRRLLRHIDRWQSLVCLQAAQETCKLQCLQHPMDSAGG